MDLYLIATSGKAIAMGRGVSTAPDIKFWPMATDPQIDLGSTSIYHDTSSQNLVLSTYGQVFANGGIATLYLAQTIQDGDFGQAPLTGTIIVDTAKRMLAVKTAASTWQAADLYGHLACIGPYEVNNPAANSTGDADSVDSWGGLARFSMPFNGHVVAISVRGSGSVTTANSQIAIVLHSRHEFRITFLRCCLPRFAEKMEKKNHDDDNYGPEGQIFVKGAQEFSSNFDKFDLRVT